MSNILKKDVIVLGGGLAGLACADELLRKSSHKVDVLVLEKNTYLGGLAATFKHNGFRFDLAPHRWFTKNEELNKWIKELMGKEMIKVKKYTPLYQHGKLFNYPVELPDVLRKLRLDWTAWMLITYVWAKITGKIFGRKIKTMKDAYIGRFGHALYKWFNKEYNEKLWGEGGCESMSADWVNQRTKSLSLVTLIKNALGLGGVVISLTPEFLFPKLGIGRVSANLKKRIESNGGEIRMENRVTKISWSKSGYQMTTDKGVYKTRYLVSSIPLDFLVKNLNPKLPKKILQAANRLSYVHQKIVVLLANKRCLTDFTWIYVHPPKIKFFRFLETNNWSTAMSPPGKTSLVFEYPYQSGNKIEKLSDKKIIDLTISDFITHFSSKTQKTDFLKGFVFNVPRAYPKYDLHYAKPLQMIKDYLRENFSGLQCIGRNGMFRYNNMDHSIYTGQLAARNIIAGKILYNIDWVNNEAEYLEEKKS